MTASTATRNATAAAAFRAIAHSRRSSRRFQPNRLIEKTVVKDILQCTLRSPSSFNLMPTQLILMQNDSLKTKLADSAMLGAGNQYRVRDSSMVAVFLADLELDRRIDRVEQLELDSNTRDPNYLATMPIVSSFLIGEGHAATAIKQAATSIMSEVQPMPSIEPVQAWSYKNAALLAQTYVLASTSHGLATCIMEGFDVRRTKDVLRIPDRYAVPLMVATGYEYEDESTFQQTPRLDVEEVVFADTFGEPIDLEDGEPNDEDGVTIESA